MQKFPHHENEIAQQRAYKGNAIANVWMHNGFININNQKFIIDFCLILNNKTIFIEYNGIQHYVPIKHFGGKLRFEKQKERDNLLREYCLNNNIILLEYKYDIPFYELYDIIKDDIKQIKNQS